ncbi:MAG TPA: hypothetical protein VI978_02835 [Candidatus Paceibacterota bacterium]
MKIIGGSKLPSNNGRSQSQLGHYRGSDLAREFKGTFLSESRGRLVFFGEVDSDEPNLRPFRNSFKTAEDVAAPEQDSFNGPSADTLTEALNLDAKVVVTIGNNPQFLAIAFHVAQKEMLFELINILPAIAQYSVAEFGSEAVISALESERAQDDVDSLFSLVRAARVELANQRSGRFDRGVACGILQVLGFTPEEIGRIKATDKIRPASLTAAA